jgi:TRAP transporter TAXI family solute receptor
MTVRIGTAEAGGTFYTQGEAIAELFNRGRVESDWCVVHISDASIDNANLLDRAELEFGFMASNWIGRAKNGTPPFGKSIPLRMVAPANAGPIFFVTLADSHIRTIDDFRGRRIALGAESSGMVQHAHTILPIVGLSFDMFTAVYLNHNEGADALVAGEVDALFLPPIPNRMVTELSERADLRVVPYAPGQIDSILSQVSFYRPIIIQKGGFRGVRDDVPQVAVVNVIVTHERVAEPVVYDMARTLAANLDALPTMNPLFRGLKDLFLPLRTRGASAFEFGGVPLHPGAARAYRATGWMK